MSSVPLAGLVWHIWSCKCGTPGGRLVPGFSCAAYRLLQGGLRVMIGGWLALGITYGIGRGFGSAA